ncbi:hypothetical protein L6164_021886 [Bauhinia variegata]|uniref:Uncharacterized protein n=1 Tax=Bauhinia variegata TaxID=167791 RepID=A0ACB9MDB3_BAUVA|nr:hypothetical protein L6164_021886 [Bauhinia variegata]
MYDWWEIRSTTMNGKFLALSPAPLRVQRPERHSEDEEEETARIDTQKEKELQIVSPSSFTLPDDWIVEEKPRPSTTGLSKQVDKYYYEPDTRRKFRSLISVQRYLYGDEREVFSSERVKSENENALQIVPRNSGTTSFLKLPDDWIVVEKPRTNINYAGRIDRSYIEPGTGQRFRSLRAVERYLVEENASSATTKPLLKSGCGKKRATGKNSPKAVSNCSTVAEEDRVTLKAMKLAICSKKKINLGKKSKALMLEFSSPPAKVNWVLSDSGGVWSPFLNNSEIPESVKLRWSEAFVLSINAGYHVAPNC